METKLSDRKHTILMCSIDDYIADASPITSSAVQDKHLQDISSATLRNELNALEAMGYLKQLHTSGGRVPTTLGYNYYVQNLLKDTKVDEQGLEEVRDIISQKTKNISEVVSSIADVVSQIAKYPTVIIMNGYDKLEVDGVDIIPLIDNELLMLLKTKNGNIHQVIKAEADKKTCFEAGVFLTKHFAGKTIGQMIEVLTSDKSGIISELGGYKIIVDKIIDVLKELATSGTVDIKRGGTAKLLNDSKNSVEQAKNILSLLENEEGLRNVIDVPDDTNEITYVPYEDDAMSGCAVVKAPIIIDGKHVASVGVLGPHRMDYSLIASALKLVVEELGEKNKYIEGEKKDNGNKE